MSSLLSSLSRSLSLLTLLLLLVGCISARAAVIKPMTLDSIPAAHLIPDMPYHEQLTDFTCGDASLQMVLDYYGADVDQYSICDAARTTADQGTLSYDVTRVGHFSVMSSAVGDLYPDIAPINGFPGHQLGLAAFDYDSQTPWLDELKVLIASNIPVICEMWFSHVESEGHFRVVVGYNDTAGEITLHDPWDYYDNPAIAVWTYENFTSLWNYTETLSPRKNPYMGAAIYPWVLTADVATTDTESVVFVNVSYPCFAPFNCSTFQARNVLVNLNLPENTTVSIDQQQGYLFPGLAAGESIAAKWVITCGDECQGKEISITAQGVIQGWLPATYKTATINYPPYSYTDIIGNSITITL